MDFMLFENSFLLYIFIPGSFHRCQYTSRCWQEAWQSEWRPCTSMDVPAKHECSRPDPMDVHSSNTSERTGLPPLSQVSWDIFEVTKHKVSWKNFSSQKKKQEAPKRRLANSNSIAPPQNLGLLKGIVLGSYLQFLVPIASGIYSHPAKAQLAPGCSQSLSPPRVPSYNDQASKRIKMNLRM